MPSRANELGGNKNKKGQTKIRPIENIYVYTWLRMESNDPDPNCPLLSWDMWWHVSHHCGIRRLMLTLSSKKNSRASKNCKLPLCPAFDHAGYLPYRDQVSRLGAIELDKIAEDVLPSTQNGLATSSHEIQREIMRRSMKFFQRSNSR